MKTKDRLEKLNRLINLRGFHEQAYKFTFGYKGGMKGCYIKGEKIFAPLYSAFGKEKPKTWFY